jgi:hypothetical protein
MPISVMGRIFLYLVSTLLSSSAYAHITPDPNFLQPDFFVDWKVLETDHFRINHEPEQKAYAQRMATIAERVHARLSPWLQWQPTDKTEVVILDSVDFSNGGATPVPYNQLYIYLPTPVEGELVDQLPWLELVFTHEYVHVLQLDMADAGPEVMRDIFGRVSDSVFIFLFFPQIFSPSWVTEVIAVYGESNFPQGYGRLNSAWYEAQMRMEVERGLRSLTEESYEGYSNSRWPYGQIYLYGGWFFKFVEETYGRDVLTQYFLQYSGNLIPWRMDSRAHEVFGKSGKNVWLEFEVWLKQRFEPQLRQIKQAATVQHRTLFDTPYLNTAVTIAGNGDVYFIHDDSASTPKVVHLRTNGQTEELFELIGIQDLDWHDKNGLLITRFGVCENNKLFSDLFRWDPHEDELTQLTECGRYVRASWQADGRGIAAVQLDGAKSRVVLLDNTGKQTAVLSEHDQGDAIGHLDVSADGASLVASVKREKTGWNIEKLDIATKSWTRLTWNNDREIRPRFSLDGKSVYFLSDRDMVWNVRRVALDGTVVETLSNTLSAVQEAVETGNGNFVMVEYTAEGLAIVELPSPTAVNDTYASKSREEPHVNTIINNSDYRPHSYVGVEDYSSWETLYPRSWFPLFSISSKEDSFLGISLRGSDILGFHRWNLSPLYFYDIKEFGGIAGYSLNDRIDLSVSRLFDAYSESGTNNEFLEDELRVQLLATQYINSIESSWLLAAGIANENIDTTVSQGAGQAFSTRDTLTGAFIRYDNTESYLRSISFEHGRRVLLTGESYDLVGSSDHEGDTYRLDWNEFFSLGSSHVLKLRAMGATGGDGIRFYRMGGELDELSDIGGATGLGRRKFALRGYPTGLPSLRGSDMALVSAEWRIPLGLVYDGWFVPPLGIGRHALALFVDSGDAWFDNESADFKTGAGVEWNVEGLLGYNLLPLGMKVSYAHGFDEGGDDRVYFQLGLSFL